MSANVVGVRLREPDVARVLVEHAVHDDVADERDLAARVALLFVPRQPEAVTFERRHDVVELVAVDVVDAHLRAAGAAL